MSEFPSSLERTAASSLLLLSIDPFFSFSSRLVSEERLSLVSKTNRKDCLRLSLSVASTGSRSCSSAPSSDDRSSQMINDHNLSINSMGSHLSNLKTVRKRHSKVLWSSNNLKLADLMNPSLDIPSVSNDSKEESCLSSGSSVASSQFKIRNKQRRNEMVSREQKKKNSSSSSSIRRRAEAVLVFLSTNCSSEPKIRQMVGDTPDTSKALRMLLKMEKVERSGTGGRRDPYIYKIV